MAYDVFISYWGYGNSPHVSAGTGAIVSIDGNMRAVPIPSNRT